MFFITLIWTIGVKVKPESWGPVAFKTSILWWISILFVFFMKVSPFYFLLMVPVSLQIASFAASTAEVNYAIKNKLTLESMSARATPKMEGLLRSLLYYFIFFIIVYFVNNFFFG